MPASELQKKAIYFLVFAGLVILALVLFPVVEERVRGDLAAGFGLIVAKSLARAHHKMFCNNSSGTSKTTFNHHSGSFASNQSLGFTSSSQTSRIFGMRRPAFRNSRISARCANGLDLVCIRTHNVNVLPAGNTSAQTVMALRNAVKNCPRCDPPSDNPKRNPPGCL